MLNSEQKHQRSVAMAKSGGVCEVCGRHLVNAQGAHRIANTKANRSRWGSIIIDAPENIAIVCSLKCNDSVNIGMNEGECLRLAQSIIEKKLRRFI